jgi:hypothetical protein
LSSDLHLDSALLAFFVEISSESSRASLAASGLTSPSNGQRLGSFLASEKYKPRSYTLGLLVKRLSDPPQGLQTEEPEMRTFMLAVRLMKPNSWMLKVPRYLVR